MRDRHLNADIATERLALVPDADSEIEGGNEEAGALLEEAVAIAVDLGLGIVSSRVNLARVATSAGGSV